MYKAYWMILLSYFINVLYLVRKCKKKKTKLDRFDQ